MLDFCAEHGITSDVEIIPIQKINEAYERMLKSDVRYRFVIDMASLGLEGTGSNYSAPASRARLARQSRSAARAHAAGQTSSA
jgi:hypothetical protein